MHIPIKRPSVFVFVAIAIAMAGVANASPVFNSASSGSVVVSKQENITTVSQSSKQATLNWNSFNVDVNESVQFQQPNAQALAINNILDQNPSQILGSVSANGRIVLLNPNGFYFGAGSSVSAHTFIAAATKQSNTIFNGITNTLTIINQSQLTGDIVGQGSMQAQRVQLSAKNITYTGSITTPHAGSITIRSRKNIDISGTITSPQGSIDIFAVEGVATATDDALIITRTDAYDASLTPGFVEFSGKGFSLPHTANPFLLSDNDTFLLDPDQITIQSPCLGGTCLTAPSFSGTINATDAASDGINTSFLSTALINSIAGDIMLEANNLITVNAVLNISNDITFQTICTTCTGAGFGVVFNQNFTTTGSLTINASHVVTIANSITVKANTITIAATGSTSSGITINGGKLEATDIAIDVDNGGITYNGTTQTPRIVKTTGMGNLTIDSDDGAGLSTNRLPVSVTGGKLIVTGNSRVGGVGGAEYYLSSDASLSIGDSQGYLLDLSVTGSLNSIVVDGDITNQSISLTATASVIYTSGKIAPSGTDDISITATDTDIGSSPLPLLLEIPLTLGAADDSTKNPTFSAGNSVYLTTNQSIILGNVTAVDKLHITSTVAGNSISQVSGAKFSTGGEFKFSSYSGNVGTILVPLTLEDNTSGGSVTLIVTSATDNANEFNVDFDCEAAIISTNCIGIVLGEIVADKIKITATRGNIIAGAGAGDIVTTNDGYLNLIATAGTVGSSTSVIPITQVTSSSTDTVQVNSSVSVYLTSDESLLLGVFSGEQVISVSTGGTNKDITIDSTGSITAADITFSTSGNIVIDGSIAGTAGTGGAITLTAGSASIAGKSITQNDSLEAIDITISASGVFTQNGTLTADTTSGTISITTLGTGNDITHNDDIVGFTIDITSSGLITQTDGEIITSHGGGISLTTPTGSIGSSTDDFDIVQMAGDGSNNLVISAVMGDIYIASTDDIYVGDITYGTTDTLANTFELYTPGTLANPYSITFYGDVKSGTTDNDAIDIENYGDIIIGTASAAASFAGDVIDIVSTNGNIDFLGTSSSGSTISGDEITVDTTTGNITTNSSLNGVISSSGDITISAAAGSIGSVGMVTNRFLVDTTAYSATENAVITANGFVGISATDALGLGSLTTNDGDIDIKTTDDIFILGAVTADTVDDSIVIEATGNITLMNDGSDITASVISLSVLGSTNSIIVSDSGALLDAVSGTISLSSVGGSAGATGAAINIKQGTGSATANLTIDVKNSAYIDSSANDIHVGSVSFGATSSNTLDVISAAALTTYSDITVDASTNDSVVTLTANSGAITFSNDGTTATSIGGTVTATASGAITLAGTASANTTISGHLISLTATGGAITSSDSGNVITNGSGAFSFTAGGSVGSATTAIEVHTDGTSDGLTISAPSGDIYLSSVENLELLAITSATGAANVIDIQVGGTTKDLSLGGDIAGAIITVTASNDISMDGDIAGSSIYLLANNDITYTSGTITSANGDIDLEATTGNIGTATTVIPIVQTATTNGATVIASGDTYVSSTSSVLLDRGCSGTYNAVTAVCTASTTTTIDLAITGAGNTLTLAGELSGDAIILSAVGGIIDTTTLAHVISSANGSVSLTSTGGAVGDVTNPIGITQVTSPSVNTITVEANGNIYIDSNTTLSFGSVCSGVLGTPPICTAHSSSTIWIETTVTAPAVAHINLNGAFVGNDIEIDANDDIVIKELAGGYGISGNIVNIKATKGEIVFENSVAANATTLTGNDIIVSAETYLYSNASENVINATTGKISITVLSATGSGIGTDGTNTLPIYVSQTVFTETSNLTAAALYGDIFISSTNDLGLGNITGSTMNTTSHDITITTTAGSAASITTYGDITAGAIATNADTITLEVDSDVNLSTLGTGSDSETITADSVIITSRADSINIMAASASLGSTFVSVQANTIRFTAQDSITNNQTINLIETINGSATLHFNVVLGDVGAVGGEVFVKTSDATDRFSAEVNGDSYVNSNFDLYTTQICAGTISGGSCSTAVGSTVVITTLTTPGKSINTYDVIDAGFITLDATGDVNIYPKSGVTTQITATGSAGMITINADADINLKGTAAGAVVVFGNSVTLDAGTDVSNDYAGNELRVLSGNLDITAGSDIGDNTATSVPIYFTQAQTTSRIIATAGTVSTEHIYLRSTTTTYLENVIGVGLVDIATSAGNINLYDEISGTNVIIYAGTGNSSGGFAFKGTIAGTSNITSTSTTITDGVTLTVYNSITSDVTDIAVAGTSYTIANTIEAPSGTITLETKSSTGSIGTNTNAIYINQGMAPTGVLSITTNTSSYVYSIAGGPFSVGNITSTAGVTFKTFADGSDILINGDINADTILLETIGIGSDIIKNGTGTATNVTGDDITFKANGNIQNTSTSINTITAYTGEITLESTTGYIGTSTNKIIISQPAHAEGLVAKAESSSGSIYITSSTSHIYVVELKLESSSSHSRDIDISTTSATLYNIILDGRASGDFVLGGDVIFSATGSIVKTNNIATNPNCNRTQTFVGGNACHVRAHTSYSLTALNGTIGTSGVDNSILLLPNSTTLLQTLSTSNFQVSASNAADTASVYLELDISNIGNIGTAAFYDDGISGTGTGNDAWNYLDGTILYDKNGELVITQTRGSIRIDQSYGSTTNRDCTNVDNNTSSSLRACGDFTLITRGYTLLSSLSALSSDIIFNSSNGIFIEESASLFSFRSVVASSDSNTEIDVQNGVIVIMVSEGSVASTGTSLRVDQNNHSTGLIDIAVCETACFTSGGYLYGNIYLVSDTNLRLGRIDANSTAAYSSGISGINILGDGSSNTIDIRGDIDGNNVTLRAKNNIIHTPVGATLYTIYSGPKGTGANGGFITITADDGSIGTSASYIRLAQNANTNPVTATANSTSNSTSGNIYLESIETSLLFDVITGRTTNTSATSGNVYLDTCVGSGANCDTTFSGNRELTITGAVTGRTLYINGHHDVDVSGDIGELANTIDTDIYSRAGDITISADVASTNIFMQAFDYIEQPSNVDLTRTGLNGTLTLYSLNSYVGTITNPIFIRQEAYTTTGDLIVRAYDDVYIQSEHEITLGNSYSFNPTQRVVQLEISACVVAASETCDIVINDNLTSWYNLAADGSRAVGTTQNVQSTDRYSLISNAGDLVNTGSHLIEAFTFYLDFPEGSVGSLTNFIRVSTADETISIDQFNANSFKVRAGGSNGTGVYLSSGNNSIYSLLVRDNNQGTNAIRFVNPSPGNALTIYLIQEVGNMESRQPNNDISKDKYGCLSITACEIFILGTLTDVALDNFTIILESTLGHVATNNGINRSINIDVTTLILISRTQSIGTQTYPILTNDSITYTIAGPDTNTAIYLRGNHGDLLNNASYFDFGVASKPMHTLSINRITPVVLNQSFSQDNFNLVTGFTYDPNTGTISVAKTVNPTGVSLRLELLASGSTGGIEHGITINSGITFIVDELELHANGSILNSGGGSIITANNEIELSSDFGDLGALNDELVVQYDNTSQCEGNNTSCAFITSKNLYLKVLFDSSNPSNSYVFNTNNIYLYGLANPAPLDQRLNAQRDVVIIVEPDNILLASQPEISIQIGSNTFGVSRLSEDPYTLSDGSFIADLPSNPNLTNLTLTLDASYGRVFGSRSSYNGSGVLFDIHARSVTIEAEGVYGIQGSNRYPLVVQFDRPFDDNSAVASILSITTTGTGNDGDIHISSNLSILGHNYTTVANDIQGIYTYQYSCQTASTATALAICRGTERNDDNYFIIESVYASCATSCLLGGATTNANIDSVAQNDDELYLTAENGSIVNVAGENRGLVAGSYVELIASGTSGTVGVAENALVVGVYQECTTTYSAFTIIYSGDCSGVAPNLHIVSSSEVYLESNDLISLLGTDDASKLTNSIDFTSTSAGVLGQIHYTFREGNFVFSKNKTCDSANSNAGIPALTNNNGNPDPASADNCYDVTISSATYNSNVQEINLEITLLDQINNTFLVHKHKNGRADGSDPSLPVNENIVFVHTRFKTVAITTPGSVGTQLYPFEFPLTYDRSLLPVYTVTASMSFYAQTTGSCFSFTVKSNGIFFCKQLLGDIIIPSLGLGDDLSVNTALDSIGYLRKVTLIADKGNIVTGASGPSIGNQTSFGKIYSLEVDLQAAGNIGISSRPVFVQVCDDTSTNRTCNYPSTDQPIGQNGTLSLTFNSGIAVTSPILNVQIDANVELIAMRNENFNSNQATIDITVLNGGNLAFKLPSSDFANGTGFDRDLLSFNVDGDVTFDQSPLAVPNASCNASQMFTTPIDCGYPIFIAQNVTIITGGDIGSIANPLLVDIPNTGRIQLRTFKSFGLISLATNTLDITDLIVDTSSIQFCAPNPALTTCSTLSSVDYRSLYLYQYLGTISLVRNLSFATNISLTLDVINPNNTSSIDLAGFSINSGIVSINIDGTLEQSNVVSDSEIYSTRESIDVTVYGDIVNRATGPINPEVALRIYTTSAGRGINIISTTGNLGNEASNTFVELGLETIQANVLLSVTNTVALYSTNRVFCYIRLDNGCATMQFTDTAGDYFLYLYQAASDIVLYNSLNLLDGSLSSVSYNHSNPEVSLFIELGQFNRSIRQADPDEDGSQCSYVISSIVANCELTASKLYLYPNGQIGNNDNYLLVRADEIRVGDATRRPTQVYLASQYTLNIYDVFTQDGPNTVAMTVFGPNNDFVLRNDVSLDDNWTISSQNDIINVSSITNNPRDSVVLSVASVSFSARGDIGTSSLLPFIIQLNSTNRSIGVGQFGNIATQPANVYLTNQAFGLNDSTDVIISGIYTNPTPNQIVEFENETNGNIILSAGVFTNDFVTLISQSNIYSQTSAGEVTGSVIILETPGTIGLSAESPVYITTSSSASGHVFKTGSAIPDDIFISTDNTLYLGDIQVDKSNSIVSVVSTGVSSLGDIYIRGTIEPHSSVSQNDLEILITSGRSLYNDVPNAVVTAKTITLNVPLQVGLFNEEINISLVGATSELLLGTRASGRPQKVYLTSSDTIRIGRIRLSSALCTTSAISDCIVYIENDYRLHGGSANNSIIFLDSVVNNNAHWILRTNNLYQQASGINANYLSFDSAHLLVSNEIGVVDSTVVLNTNDYFFVNQIAASSTLYIGLAAATPITTIDGVITVTNNYLPADVRIGAANVGTVTSNLHINNITLSNAGGTVKVVAYDPVRASNVILDDISTLSHDWEILSSGSITQTAGAQLIVQSLQLYSPAIVGNSPSEGSVLFNENAFDLTTTDPIVIGTTSGTIAYHGTQVNANPVSVYITSTSGSISQIAVNSITTNSASGTVRLSADNISLLGTSETNDTWFIYAQNNIVTNSNVEINAYRAYLWANIIGGTTPLFINTTDSIYFGSTEFSFITANSPVINNLQIISNADITIAVIETDLTSEDTVSFETLYGADQEGRNVILLPNALQITSNDHLTIVSSKDIIAGSLVQNGLTTLFEPSVYYAVSFNLEADRNIGTTLYNISKSSAVYQSILQRFPERSLITTSIGVTNTETNISVFVPVIIKLANSTSTIELQDSNSFRASFARGLTIADPSLPVFALLYQEEVLASPINIFNIVNAASALPDQQSYVGLTVLGDLIIYNDASVATEPFEYSTLILSAISGTLSGQANIVNNTETVCVVGTLCERQAITARQIDLYAEGRIGTDMSLTTLNGGILITTTPYDEVTKAGLQQLHVTARTFSPDSTTTGGVFLASNLIDNPITAYKQDVFNLLPNRLDTNQYSWIGTGVQRIGLFQHNGDAYLDGIQIDLPDYTLALHILDGSLLHHTNSIIAYTDSQFLDYDAGSLSTSLIAKDYTFLAGQALIVDYLELNVKNNIGNLVSDVLTYDSIDDIAPIPLDPQNVYFDASGIVNTITINTIRDLASVSNAIVDIPTTQYSTKLDGEQSILLMVRKPVEGFKEFYFDDIIGNRISIVGINQPTLSIATLGAYSYFADGTADEEVVFDKGTDSIRIQGVGTLKNYNDYLLPGSVESNVNARKIDIRVVNSLGELTKPIVLGYNSFGEKEINQVVLFSNYIRPYVQETYTLNAIKTFDIIALDEMDIVRLLWVSYLSIGSSTLSDYIYKTQQSLSVINQEASSYNLVTYLTDIFNGSEQIEGLLREYNKGEEALNIPEEVLCGDESSLELPVCAATTNAQASPVSGPVSGLAVIPAINPATESLPEVVE